MVTNMANMANMLGYMVKSLANMAKMLLYVTKTLEDMTKKLGYMAKKRSITRTRESFQVPLLNYPNIH